MQDIEFTVEDGKLFILQTRNGKRTGMAAVNIAVDMFNEGSVTKEQAVMMVEPGHIDQLLHQFGLVRSDLSNTAKVDSAVRTLSRRMPTYVTIKDVKKRWGHGQEDIFPVSQFEKLWGDMTALPELDCGYVVVPRARGQQLKEVAQLDGWLRDGSAAYLESLCDWDDA